MASKIPSTVRNSVWNTYVGATKKTSLCFCCGTEHISTANYQCGHVQSKKMGGSMKIENLRPICGQCNTSMGTKNMDEFMETYGFKKCKNYDGICDEKKSTKSIKSTKSTKSTKETKNESSIVASIDDLLLSFSLKKLRTLCIYYCLTKSGTKKELIRKIADSSAKLNAVNKLVNSIKNIKFIISVEGNKKCNTCDFIEDKLHFDETEQGLMCTHVFFSHNRDCKIHSKPLYNMHIEYNEFYEEVREEEKDNMVSVKKRTLKKPLEKDNMVSVKKRTSKNPDKSQKTIKVTEDKKDETHTIQEIHDDIVDEHLHNKPNTMTLVDVILKKNANLFEFGTPRGKPPDAIIGSGQTDRKRTDLIRNIRNLSNPFFRGPTIHGHIMDARRLQQIQRR
jgi:hypothetical protein